ncbi:MAG: RNA methyltransferase [Betaproteobacteria bacterium]|nr:RNA methyltransferase [Betaproteobacteria bacterium]
MTAMHLTFTHLSSRDNPRIKLFASLASMPRERRKCGQALLDGTHLIGCALDAGVDLLDVCVSESGCDNPEILALLDRLPAGGGLLCVPDALFAYLSPVETPTGIIARISLAPPDSQEEVEHETIIVLDGIQDPGNLGSILRTAVAAGIRLAWLTPGCAQAWSPKALRAGMGAHFCLRIHERVDVLAGLTSYQGKVVAAGVGEESRMFFDADLIGPVAWLFGAEGQGISPALLARADEILRIPMMEGIESLNVGAAVAVCLFEQMRQRGVTS